MTIDMIANDFMYKTYLPLKIPSNMVGTLPCPLVGKFHFTDEKKSQNDGWYLLMTSSLSRPISSDMVIFSPIFARSLLEIINDLIELYHYDIGTH
jgi:hypothetical protein